MSNALENIMKNTTDHNELINYFKGLDMPILEHINTCSGIAIQELNCTIEDREYFFEEFDNIYGISDEDLVIERIEELKSTIDKSDRKEALYLSKWLNKQYKIGFYV